MLAATWCDPVTRTPRVGVEIRLLWPARVGSHLALLGVLFAHQGEGISPFLVLADAVLPILAPRVGGDKNWDCAQSY